MSGELRQAGRERPLVAVVCSVPLVGEAVHAALEFAEVLSFSERGGDVDGLLRWLRPDALVVDSDATAAAASAYAQKHELPVLHIGVRSGELRLYRAGAWEHVGNGDGPTPESVRNVIAGALYARGGAVA